MLEVMMAMAISLIILAIGAGLALHGIPAERKLTQSASKLEVAARKAAMESTIYHRDAFLTVRTRSVTGVDGTVYFKGGELAISRPGKFSSFKAPPSDGYHWKFGANGLCEPLRIKLSFAEGEIELDFDPLTGETRDRSLTIFDSK
jgi:hypothetical protein